MTVQDPESYLPERFMPGTPEAAARPEHGWIPFGGGARGCPGGRFSFEEATIALVCMYQRFRFELEPGQACALAHWEDVDSAMNSRHVSTRIHVPD